MKLEFRKQESPVVKHDTLIFVDGDYRGILRKYPNNKYTQHPYTVLSATNGPGSDHQIVGHFYPEDGGKKAAIEAFKKSL